MYTYVYECATVRVYFYLVVPSINERPRIGDLQNYIIPNFATKWKEIGIGLGITQERINIIEEDNRNKCERQCIAMFSSWLEVEADNVTWKKLLTILFSPSVNINKTDPAVNIIQTNPIVNIIQKDPTVNVIQTDHGQFIRTYVVQSCIRTFLYSSNV